MSRFAAGVSDYQLAEYQQAVRTLLRSPFITETYPHARALPRVRRHAETLANDMRDAFGFQLVLRGDVARLLRFSDRLDETQPAITGTNRHFDQRRYGYLCLVVALLARAGAQTTLAELSELLSSDANRIASLGFDDDQYHHRRAYVDVIAWLERFGVLRVADGSTQQWLADPESQDALYDVDREALFALWRSRVMLQTVDSVGELLGDRVPADSDVARKELAGKAARRAVADNPVAYYAEYPEAVVNHLRGSALAEDLARLTGLVFERRREGVLLVDTTRLSVEAFPREGGPANAALLLLVECCDHYVDPDKPTPQRDVPIGADMLRHDIDAAIPTDTHLADDTRDVIAADTVDGSLNHPFIDDEFLFASMRSIMTRHPGNFGKDYHEDPVRLRREALDILERFRMVRRVTGGGVVLLPLAARYRNTVFRIATHEQETLY